MSIVSLGLLNLKASADEYDVYLIKLDFVKDR